MAKRFEEILDGCKQIVQDTNLSSVSDWKGARKSKKAIGCFPVYTPEEVIHAAGMLPVGLLGGGGIEIYSADSRIQSFVCAIARSTLELGLKGRLNILDGVVFPSICDVARNLAGIWRRNFPTMFVEYVHFPQNITSAHAVEYLVSELLKLKTGLERMSGKKISNDDIANSIKIYNENRALVSKLYQLRTKKPWAISTSELYTIIRTGRFIPKEKHSIILQSVLDAIEKRERKQRDSLRVIIEGSFCEQPPIELLETIEEAGCYIIDDDLSLSSRWYEEPIQLNGNPLESLAYAYVHNAIKSSVRHNHTKPRDIVLVEKFRELKADGVIFCSAKFCDPALFDFVLMKNTLEREGIPYISFEFEEKMSAFDNVRTQIETFVESIMFFA